LETLVEVTEGMTGAEIGGLVYKVILTAIKREGWKSPLSLTIDDVESAISEMHSLP
jgi:SpoVK/Ycf46/Vps4 family AAA+-type ATPase